MATRSTWSRHRVRIERPGGFKHEIEVTKIAVTERVVVTEPGGQSRLDGDLDLGSDRGIVEVAQQAEASQANPRRAVTPGVHEGRRCGSGWRGRGLPAGTPLTMPRRRRSPIGIQLAQIRPVAMFGCKAAPLVGESVERHLAEPWFAGQ